VKEKAIDQKIERWRKKYLPQVISIKLSTLGMYGSAGWPDRIFLGAVNCRPSVLFMELKATGKLSEVTEIQAERHKELRDLGFTVEVCDDGALGIAYLFGWFGGQADGRGVERDQSKDAGVRNRNGKTGRGSSIPALVAGFTDLHSHKTNIPRAAAEGRKRIARGVKKSARVGR
jgi:hypothetical protein